MTAPSTAGTALARVTVDAGARRLDVALPADVPVAELLPELLRHAGEGLADAGERHGGWALRRVTGEALTPGRSLGAQNVRDGETLHLRPGRLDWPEPDYDDVVETIASGARRHGRSWGGRATRWATIAVVCPTVLLGLVGVLAAGPPWSAAATTAMVAALVLVVVGAVLARALGDAGAGAAVAGCGLPYAGVGGALAVASPGARLADLGPSHLLLGSVAVLLAGLVGYLAVVASARLFVAGMYAGLFGVAAGLLGIGGLRAAADAAVLVTAAVVLLPGYPLLAVRLGRLPLPALPQRPEDILADRAPPPRSEVYAAVRRTDEALTGLLLGVGVVAAAGAAALVLAGDTSTRVLDVAAAGALLLRARLFPTPRQRIPLIAAAVSALALLAVAGLVRGGLPAAAGVAAAGLLGAALLTAGLLYSVRPPSPYVGRLGDVLDVLLISTLIPVSCVTVGFYGYVQSLFASIG